ncbi:MAG: DNA recombination protein RmuC [Bacteroidales bacterium]|jgi:DNA recombination protein RmuC|nr:DNA recombination protein RmuC [Bacteroidales bacterium]
MQTLIIILLTTLIITIIVGITIGIVVLKKRTNIATDNSSSEKDFLIKEKERVILEKEKLIVLKEEELKQIVAQKEADIKNFYVQKENDVAFIRNKNEEERKELQQQIANEKIKNATSEENIKNLKELLDVQRKEQKETVEKLKTEFQNISHEILKKQSTELSETNKQKLGEILNPLKTDIDNFKKKVEESQEKNKEQFDVFGEKVKTLQDNANKISQEANNLADALKGQKKIQGNWGETILKQILENAGLIEGINYKLQESVTDENNERFFPDCVIYLPNNNAFIIDSKVSLIAYSQHFATEDAKQQEGFARMHTAAIRKHIDELAEKKYEELKGNLGFVFMFIPIEPAYLLAINNDHDLLGYAYKKNVIVVSTSTVLAAIKMVEDLWRKEEQDKNVVKIIDRAQGIYDALVRFTDTLKKVGERIDSAQKEHQRAMGQLSESKGNLIKRADELNKLGVKVRKKLPEKFLELQENDVEYIDFEEA